MTDERTPLDRLLNIATPHAPKRVEEPFQQGAGGEVMANGPREPLRRESDDGVPDDEALDTLRSSWVYAPAHPVVQSGELAVQYETRESAEGNEVLPVFANVEKLILQLGDVQPWVQVLLGELMDLDGAVPLVLDPVVASDAHRWTSGEADRALEEIKRELGRFS